MIYLKKGLERTSKSEKELVRTVEEIINEVKVNKDAALINYNIKFDQNDRTTLKVSSEEIEKAYEEVDETLLNNIRRSAENIRRFAEEQKKSMSPIKSFKVSPGVFLGHDIIAVDSCCCYVPGGGYPLFSSALMLAIPAKVAGVEKVVACSPTMKGTQSIHPATLVAMDIAGTDEIYAVGGAHAIAAFSYGTDQISPVDVIVGPGNQFVAEAKRQCYGQIGIDFIAGPSEVLIISEEIGNPKFIAADILAQSEHDYMAKGILVTTSRKLAEEVMNEVELQLKTLKTEKKARHAWETNGEIILVESIEEACRISNQLAPEHLEVHAKDIDYTKSLLKNYGSLFLGENSAEAFGDYVSGTNHTLPTLRAARYTGGLWVGTFLKVCTHQSIERKGIKDIGKIAVRMAEEEGLYAHANAAFQRLK